MADVTAPLRIGIVAPTWVPIPAPAYGGTETVIDTLARGLTAAGHHVLLIGHPDSTCPVERASVVPREDTLRMGRAATELEHAIGAYELVQGCDVVHDHTLAGPLLSRRYPTLPVVATNHMPFTRTMSAIFRAAVPPVGLIAISHSHAASTDIPIAAVVHHGVDLAEFPIGAGRGGYMASLARMAPEKGVHRAVALARAAGVQLRIAAKMREPREEQYFDEFIRPHLGDDVVYLGELGADDKRALLADATALLNPIEWPEPFGMAMVEALACGTPVIACPNGAAPEIVDHGVTGFLGSTDDELVAAIRHVGDIDRTACRQRVVELFSMERMVEGHVRVYRDQRRRLGLD
jgi:glycosyltransferase involved in cell wall biosynthesis